MKNELILKDDIILLNNKNCLLFPVIHNSPIVTALLRRSMLEYKPDILLIEQSIFQKDLILRAVSRFPFISVLRENYSAKTSYTLIHPAEAIFEGIRTALELNAEIVFADYPMEVEVEESDDSVFDTLVYPDMKLSDFWKFGINISSQRDVKSDRIREEYFGNLLYNYNTRNDKRVMAIFGISHIKGIIDNFKDNSTEIANNSIHLNERELFFLHKDSYSEILEPNSFIIECYETQRENFNFNESLLNLFKQVEKKYSEELKTEIPLPKKELFFKFSYKLALQNNNLIPNSLDMLESARSVIDDDFSFHWYNIAGSYRFMPAEGNYFLRLTPEDLGNKSISFRFRTKIKNKKRQIFRPVIRSNKRDLKEWEEKWKNNEDGYCSYQPEDRFLETYSDKIRKKVANISESKNIVTQPFVGSLLDGIDLRETLKNFHTKRLYVKDNPKLGGDVDAVVFIFTTGTEDINNQFNYKMTWWGENDQESDMSFYSTSPGEDMIGDGISRCEYGGFLLFYPRYNLSDIWKDEDYLGMKSDEALIMAAIDHSNTGNILIVAERPPNHYIKSWAKRSGKKIIFIPIGSLSPPKIRRIRMFHILQGHKTREIAEEYIDNPNQWDNTDL